MWKQRLMGHKPTQNVNSKVYLKINGILTNLTNVHNRICILSYYAQKSVNQVC